MTKKSKSKKTLGPLDTRPKSVALVALGPSNTDFVHDWAKKNKFRRVDEVWVINSGYGPFQCHKVWIMDDLKRVERRFPRWSEELKKLDKPIITCHAYPDYPSSVSYPITEIKNCIKDDLFTTSVAYCIAYAIYTKVQELYLYGCDYWYPDSPAVEPGIGEVSFLLGIARERGLRFFIPQSSTLLNAFMVRFDKDLKETGRPMYGYDYNPGDSCLNIKEGKGTEVDKMAAHLSPFVRANQYKSQGVGPDGASPANAKVQMDEEARKKHEAVMKKKDEDLVKKTIKNMETESSAPVL